MEVSKNKRSSPRNGSGLLIVLCGMLIISLFHFALQSKALIHLIRAQRIIWEELKESDKGGKFLESGDKDRK